MIRPWLLLGLLVLMIGVGALTYTLASSSPTVHHAATLPADAVALGASSSSVPAQTVALGMGSGTSDILNSSMADILQRAKLNVLRFGDIGADDYDWQGGCIYGDVGSRRECYGLAGQGGKLDQFLAFAGRIKAQPLIVVNGEVDDPQRAAGLVSYYWQHCVHAAHQQCPDPYWEIGDSPASWKHFAVPLAQRRLADAQVIQPDQYAALVIAYASAMSQADPYYQHHKIKIVADEWITGATDQSWIDTVTAIDTHYAPLLYAPPGPPPTAQSVVEAVQHGHGGRPGVDSWLQDLRDSLSQFSQSGSISIILGRWSIDANVSAVEPNVYSGYAQALFTAQMIAHVWRDAQGVGQNPILMAVQSPITGPAQEPFDITSLEPRATVSVYTLIGQHFGSHPVPLQLGSGVQSWGIAAAASLAGRGDARILLVNPSSTQSHTVELRNMPAGPYDMWWIVPEQNMPAGVSAIKHMRVSGTRITMPPWAIAVVQAHA
ncbi:MAG: hypothetical protein JWO42_2089 [Chloroflexi bacterium]|nr:hypothetical protein [Chloroflexota bacterium]